MSYIISVDRLKNRLENNLNNTLIVDVRFQLNDENAGQKTYLESHIPGAVYLDLKKDLSAKPAKHGGTHPLPDTDTFAAKMGNIGIDEETTVVVYDQNNGMFAPRFWWMLHHLGHDKVYVLDGGFDAWVEAGYETTAEIPDLNPTTFTPNPRQDETVDIDDVKQRSDDVLLIDSRSHERYMGENEPMYSRAGHIPGAKNYFWKNVLDEKGNWKTKDDLAENFKDIPKDTEVIVSCGSGVSACPNVLGLKAAGYTNVKLYPGSFSDWISYEEIPVNKGEE
ncbi:Thiosulfate sulfurtransferase [Lentibacillus sp. JNUCC-1]|uniref:sulfurtransferase n=1 Tax=Lentibacillus sp. JNUCC-1 TaxID=2654513 RepID=UPI0012E7257D|nr:sulfurtransferase [Lentibacillus sp. JNUCC-1]MUV38376.1 Thiosulfate sulfurtransferase [Lentibacillus sp. JNUCC-1]